MYSKDKGRESEGVGSKGNHKDESRFFSWCLSSVISILPFYRQTKNQQCKDFFCIPRKKISTRDPHPRNGRRETGQKKRVEKNFRPINGRLSQNCLDLKIQPAQVHKENVYFIVSGCSYSEWWQRTSQQRTRRRKRTRSDCFFFWSSSTYLRAPILAVRRRRRR